MGSPHQASGLRRLTSLARLGLPGIGAGLLALAAALATGNALSASTTPRPSDAICIKRCAGRQQVAVGGMVRITGSRLDDVTEVDFPGSSGYLQSAPAVARRHLVEVRVPEGTRTGRPRVADSDGHGIGVPEILRIVPAGRLPAPGSFGLLGARVRPRRAFVDGERSVVLRYRFRARADVDVRVKLVRAGRVARRWIQRNRLPYVAHRLRWDGMRSAGHAAPRGRYRFKLTRPGHRAHSAHGFRLEDGKFPVRGPHGYGGPMQRFGAPRTGGRTHQGQDVFASCGTPVVAARGGRVQARGWDRELYGNWVVIDGRGTRRDYRSAHLRHPASVHHGKRVRTGERIGRVGKTGNARHVGCMLHFEVWPSGWPRGSPVDPLRMLKRWDRRS